MSTIFTAELDAWNGESLPENVSWIAMSSDDVTKAYFVPSDVSYMTQDEFTKYVELSGREVDIPYFWKFYRDAGIDDENVPTSIKSNHNGESWLPGETKTLQIQAVCCVRGYHASPSWWHAWRYVTGDVVAKVSIVGSTSVDINNDKIASNTMSILEAAYTRDVAAIVYDELVRRGDTGIEHITDVYDLFTYIHNQGNVFQLAFEQAPKLMSASTENALLIAENAKRLNDLNRLLSALQLQREKVGEQFRVAREAVTLVNASIDDATQMRRAIEASIADKPVKRNTDIVPTIHWQKEEEEEIEEEEEEIEEEEEENA